MLTDYSDVLLFGLRITIELALISMVFSVLIALVACMGSLARRWVLHAPAVLFVEYCRNTPILVQLVWVHFAWPDIIGVKFTAFTSAVIALSLQSGGYLAEEFRTGIESIDRGQIEASQALGMTYGRLMRRIVLPQATIRMIPGILNQFVTCFKSTSVVSIIAVPDLMYQAGLIASATFLPMPIYSFVAFVYFILVAVIALAVRYATSYLPHTGAFGGRRAGPMPA
jgi:polar amino acid transport system permease protein